MFAMTFQNNEALSHTSVTLGLVYTKTQDHKNPYSIYLKHFQVSSLVFAEDFFTGKPLKQTQQLIIKAKAPHAC